MKSLDKPIPWDDIWNSLYKDKQFLYKEQSILKCLQYSEADSENFHSTFCGPFKMSFLSKLAEYAFLKLDLFHRYYG